MTTTTTATLRERVRTATLNTAMQTTARLSTTVEQMAWLTGLVRVPILLYHQVAESGPAFPWRISPADFAAQMAWLAKHRYHVVSLADFLAMWQKGRLRPRTVVITFDDGHAGVVHHAAPVLERYGFPYAVFLATGAIGTPEFSWLAPWLEATDTEEYRPMTWDEASGLDPALATLGSHSVSHPHLGLVDPEQLTWELTHSRFTIRQATGRRVWALAYPGGIERYGDHSLETRDALGRAGYACGLVSEIGRNGVDADPLRLRRLSIEAGDTVATFRAKVVGAYTPIRTLQWAGQRLFGDAAGY
jgi:peptidoglycan/xylan/chitin deacetylase (PgdA/CDA1 family)